MGWGSFLKSTLRLGGRMTSATAHTVGSAVLHPQQTLKGVGTATKSAEAHHGQKRCWHSQRCRHRRRHHQENWRYCIWDWRWREGLERFRYRTLGQRKQCYQQCGFQVERYVWLP